MKREAKVIKRRQFIPTEESQLSFLWLEITGKCQLECAHCYADSGPTKSHGLMSCRDWERVIDDAAKIGVYSIQFIGGWGANITSRFHFTVEKSSKTGIGCRSIFKSS